MYTHINKLTTNTQTHTDTQNNYVNRRKKKIKMQQLLKHVHIVSDSCFLLNA